MRTRAAFATVPIRSLSPEVLAAAIQESQPGTRRRVLVIDDHRRIADTLVHTLELHGFCAKAAYTGEEGLALVEEFLPSIVISDVGLPCMDGITLSERIAALAPHTQVVLMCECRPQKPALVAWATLKKPFHTSELLAVIGPAEVHHG